jgi:hypothetical protein
LPVTGLAGDIWFHPGTGCLSAELFEVREILRHVHDGSPIYPLSLIAQEGPIVLPVGALQAVEAVDRMIGRIG